MQEEVFTKINKDAPTFSRERLLGNDEFGKNMKRISGKVAERS